MQWDQESENPVLCIGSILYQYFLYKWRNFIFLLFRMQAPQGQDPAGFVHVSNPSTYYSKYYWINI